MTSPAAPSAPLTMAHALSWARLQGLDRLDAQLMLQHLVQQPRSWVLAHDDTLLSAPQQAQFETLCARRLAGEPVAYLLEEWAFHGHRLRVTPAVLIPRPDTETLVDWALELLQHDPSGNAPRVVDLGTGSGAVAISVACAVPTARVLATDVSEAALAIAQENFSRLAPAIKTACGSWWGAVSDGEEFDLALSNPPYIRAGDPHLEALTFEPIGALTPGGDGLDAIRQIATGAKPHLRRGAWLLMEHGWDQAEQVTNILLSAGFTAPQTRHDMDGRARCTGAQA